MSLEILIQEDFRAICLEGNEGDKVKSDSTAIILAIVVFGWKFCTSGVEWSSKYKCFKTFHIKLTLF